VWSHGIVTSSRGDPMFHNQFRHLSSAHAERLHPTHPGVHVNATHGALGPQLLRHNRKVADHVGAGGLVIDCGSIH